MTKYIISFIWSIMPIALYRELGTKWTLLCGLQWSNTLARSVHGQMLRRSGHGRGPTAGARKPWARQRPRQAAAPQKAEVTCGCPLTWDVTWPETSPDTASSACGQGTGYHFLSRPYLTLPASLILTPCICPPSLGRSNWQIRGNTHMNWGFKARGKGRSFVSQQTTSHSRCHLAAASATAPSPFGSLRWRGTKVLQSGLRMFIRRTQLCRLPIWRIEKYFSSECVRFRYFSRETLKPKYWNRR